MRKSRFRESQIVAPLKEADAGIVVGEMIRTHGISSCHQTSLQLGKGLGLSVLAIVQYLRHRNPDIVVQD